MAKCINLNEIGGERVKFNVSSYGFTTSGGYVTMTE